MKPAPKGFAGLREIRSNLDAEVLLVMSALEVDPPVGSASPNQSGSPGAAIPKSDGTWKGVGILGGLIAVGLGVVWFVNSNSTNSPAPYYDAAPYNDPAAPAPTPPIEAPYIEPKPEGVVEERPPAGSGDRLSANEIAYCLAEHVRMSAAQSLLLSGGSASDTEDFNSRVDDYNSRCSSYRYAYSDQAAAESYVAANSESLRRAGEGRVRGEQSSGFPSTEGDGSADKEEEFQ